MKIAAVVVTYNRLNLLKECIDGIRKQTKKVDEIIVVNNGSNDGTLEWLKTQNDLRIITQENSGSAGGQYTGIKFAYENGFDWIWCMDDDCLPFANCLENQIPDDTDTITGPKVIYENEEVWNYDYKSIKYKLLEFFNLPFITIPFNGFLVSNKIVKTIGLPLRELFIYCDDVEYSYRASKFGFKLRICDNAFLSHPKSKKVNDYAQIQLYYYIRNNLFVVRKYDLFFIRTLIKILQIIRSLKFQNYKIFFKGFFDSFKIITNK